jgi:hypothetical protein
VSGNNRGSIAGALRLQLPIATLDAPLHDAALASGVGVVPEAVGSTG